ncbi:MAG: acyltransferase [Mucilaginibacter sp.]|uniref:acyltransferase n=1 Tax=Mucilaginibacter sp. TaxID=1882438 RepID=UPI003263035A
MLYKIIYILTDKANQLTRWLRFCNYTFRGAKIGKGVAFSKMHFIWPHKVSIANKCIIEHNVYFKFDGMYSAGRAINIGERTFIGTGTEFNIKHGIIIGNDCLIASGCRFVDHDHGTDVQQLMRIQSCIGKDISIADDVWIGANAVILKGVVIEKGAIIAAGAVLNKSVPANEIWGGIPARKIGQRK